MQPEHPVVTIQSYPTRGASRGSFAYRACVFSGAQWHMLEVGGPTPRLRERAPRLDTNRIVRKPNLNQAGLIFLQAARSPGQLLQQSAVPR